MYSFKMCTMSQPLNVKYLVTTSDRPKSILTETKILSLEYVKLM